MRIGMLTGGGDCPGLNAVLRAVVIRAEAAGDEVIGFRNGWRGVINNDSMPLISDVLRPLIGVGGTILGTSRTNPLKSPDGAAGVAASCAEAGIDVLIAIGGDDTLGAAAALATPTTRMIGVPKTIDNDLSATEMTFGFDTAVQIATEAIDRLWTTARSHDRAMVCEVMGRNAGHLAAWAGIAGGATATLVPEEPIDIAAVCATLSQRHAEGQRGFVVVVSEGAHFPAGGTTTVGNAVDEFGHAQLGGIGHVLADAIEEGTGIDTRASVLGHIQRGGSPTAYDRVLATRFGVAAYEAAAEGVTGQMVALRAGAIVLVPLDDAVSEPRLVDMDLVHDVARKVV